MNKLDKQFEQMMKGIRIDSPSTDFTVQVMSRIQAEAAVQKRSILQDYQPVISRKAWIILILAFVLILIYSIVSTQDAAPAADKGIWSTISGTLDQIKTSEVSSLWQKGMGLFASIPSIALLILTATLALWTLDSFLGRFRHESGLMDFKVPND